MSIIIKKLQICTLITLLFLISIVTVSFAENKRNISKCLTKACRIALAETIHARQTCGDLVWPGWNKTSCILNVITKDYEFLIGSDQPTDEYTFLEHDKLINSDIYVKPRTFKHLLIGSVMPFNKKMAIFISPPELFIEKFKIDMIFYRTLLLHEMFHIHQFSHFPDGINGLAAYQLSTKYPYKTEPNNQIRGREAGILKKALLAKNPNVRNQKIKLFLETRQDRRYKMLSQSPDKYSPKSHLYEKLREWQEGLARYTEVKMNEEMTTFGYKAIPEFTKYITSRKSTYEREMNKLDMLSLNAGEESDYALGWIQWYILDKLYPSWKSKAFEKNYFPEDLLKKCINL